MSEPSRFCCSFPLNLRLCVSCCSFLALWVSYFCIPRPCRTYLPLFTRTIALIESRRDSNGLFLVGDAANLLAPSAGGWLLPNGTRAYAWLTGLSVTYVAAMDRMIELRTLVGDVSGAARDAAARDAAIAALPLLLAPDGDYFVKWMDPDEAHTLHGVLGQAQHGYIEAVANHDAVAFGVADRVSPGLSEKIMARLLGSTVPPNPVTGGPGLRPYSLVITNAASLDDMEYPPTSWLWQYGTWVNGGEWATCEARMMLAYARTNRSSFSLDSFRALMGYASEHRTTASMRIDLGTSLMIAALTLQIYFEWIPPSWCVVMGSACVRHDQCLPSFSELGLRGVST